MIAIAPRTKWACGAAGSALPWHGRGRRFDPDQVHHFQLLADTPLFSLVSFGVTVPEILLLSLKTLGAIPTRSTIFSTTCRYPYLQLDLIWLQNAVTASFVWKRSLARSRSGPPSFGTNASLALFGVLTPVLAKHSKSFSLVDCISVGVLLFIHGPGFKRRQEGGIFVPLLPDEAVWLGFAGTTERPNAVRISLEDINAV